MGTLEAAARIATGLLDPHYMTEYARRLAVKVPPGQLTRAESQFVNPELLVPNLYYITGPKMPSPGSNPGASPPVYKVYLAYNYGAAGISEEWYSTLNPDVIRTQTIQLYLQYRMALAVSDFQFVYARISTPSSKRWVDFVTANDDGITKYGMLGGNIKAAPAVGAEDDGALLSRMKLVGGPSARQFLHGFDQTQTNEGTFTPNKAWKTSYAAYSTFLQGAAAGILWAFGPQNPTRLAITDIVAKPIRGFTITPKVADPVIAVGNKVYVGGVGRGIVGASGPKIVTDVAVGGATFDVGGASPVGTYGGVGGFYYQTGGNQAIVKYMQVERLTSHRVGRPFAEPRGRRSARLSLRL
jgi:hypothetical protein